MQEIIEFRGGAPRCPSTERGPQALPAPKQKSIPTIAAIFDSLSRILDRISNLCEIVPDGPIREQFETERARLMAKLNAVRLTAAQISIPQARTSGSAGLYRPAADRALSGQVSS